MSDSSGRNIALDGGSVVVRVPIRLTRRRGRREIVAPGSLVADTGASLRPSASLSLTLARAYRWRDLLEQGRRRSIRELALELGVDNSYVARLLRLALLAPDLVEAVLAGTEPGGLSLEHLFRMPLDWESQRRETGAFSHPEGKPSGSHNVDRECCT
jgi:hypothetical protein